MVGESSLQGRVLLLMMTGGVSFRSSLSDSRVEIVIWGPTLAVREACASVYEPMAEDFKENPLRFRHVCM